MAESLPFADAPFDVEANSMFAHHLYPELRRLACAGMHPVLRPGGALLTADVDRPTTAVA